MSEKTESSVKSGVSFDGMSEAEILQRKKVTLDTMEKMFEMAREKTLPVVFVVVMDASDLNAGMAIQNTFNLDVLGGMLGNAVAGLAHEERAGASEEAGKGMH